MPDILCIDHSTSNYVTSHSPLNSLKHIMYISTSFCNLCEYGSISHTRLIQDSGFRTNLLKVQTPIIVTLSLSSSSQPINIEKYCFIILDSVTPDILAEAKTSATNAEG